MADDIKKILGEILTSIKNLEVRVAHIENKPTISDSESRPTATVAKRISMKEFLIDHTPTNAVQATLAIAYYLEKYDGMSTFNAADLVKGFRAAKEPVPTNINDKVNMSIKNGHLMEAEAKKDNMKAWEITRSGEKYVEEGLLVKNKNKN